MNEIYPQVNERFHFDASDPLFEDHFPGRPVIPGSLVLDCFQKAIRDRLMSQEKPFLVLAGIRNARFIRFGRPGWVEVEISHMGVDDGRIIFSCLARQDGQTLSSALLQYGRS